MSAVESYSRGNIHVAHTVAVSETEVLQTQEPGCAFQSPARHGGLARVDDRHSPRLGFGLVNLHLVPGNIKCHTRHVQEIVGEVFLDHVPAITGADDEIIDAGGGVELHHVPQDGPVADFDHGLRPQLGFFADSRSPAACENDCLHQASFPAVFFCRPSMSRTTEQT